MAILSLGDNDATTGSNPPPCGSSRPVIRGSDDYWPEDAVSHGPHLYCNAMASLLFAGLGVHDWDMFQTNQGATSYMHAAAR